MIRHMRHGSPPRLMALQSILNPTRRESLPTPSAGVRRPRPTSPAGGGSTLSAPVQAGSSNAAPTRQPAAAGVAPKPGGQASQPPAGGTPGTAPLGNASATSAGGGPSP